MFPAEPMQERSHYLSSNPSVQLHVETQLHASQYFIICTRLCGSDVHRGLVYCDSPRRRLNRATTAIRDATTVFSTLRSLIDGLLPEDTSEFPNRGLSTPCAAAMPFLLWIVR